MIITQAGAAHAAQHAIQREHPRSHMRRSTHGTQHTQHRWKYPWRSTLTMHVPALDAAMCAEGDICSSRLAGGGHGHGGHRGRHASVAMDAEEVRGGVAAEAGGDGEEPARALPAGVAAVAEELQSVHMLGADVGKPPYGSLRLVRVEDHMHGGGSLGGPRSACMHR